MRILLSLLLGLSSSAYSHTPISEFEVQIDKSFDTDFFRPDVVRTSDAPKGFFSVELLLERKGKLEKVSGLNSTHSYMGTDFSFSMDGKLHKWKVCEKNPTKEFYISIMLDDSEYYRVENHKEQPYEIYTKVECSKKSTLIFNEDSFGGGALHVRRLAHKTYEKFKAIDRLDFWNKRVEIVYPGGGNFYDFKKVYVHKGYMWDIVGHEIAHAIYDMADIGKNAAGEHWIDRCHWDNIAFSEGWASFFSAWLSIDLDDPNAAFEYMVPRRAPLSIEFVPSDVCKGTTNEWRVYSFLWDLIDTNIDGENMNISFKKLWDLTVNKHYTSVSQLKEDLLLELDPVLINILWDQNILGK